VSKQVWRILLVDDDRDDYLLVKAMLGDARRDEYQLEWAGTYQEGQEALQKNNYDAVLVDYNLGSFCGLDLIEEVVAQGYHAPLILLTGRGSYEVDLQAMQSGADDYLDKGEINASYLERNLRYAIERKRIQTSLADAKERLEEANQRLEVSNQQFSALFAQTPAGLVLFEAEEPFRVLMHNEEYQSSFPEPFRSQGMVGLGLLEYIPTAEADGILSLFRQVVKTGQGVTSYEFAFSGMPEGTTWWNWHLNPIFSGGKITGLLHMALNVTGQHRMKKVLQEREAHLRLLYESMLQGVVFQDAAGKVTSKNPSADHILGGAVEAFFDPQKRDGRLNIIHSNGTPFTDEEHPPIRALKTGQEVRGILMGFSLPEEQTRRWIMISAVPQFQPGASSPDRVFTIFEDITGQKQLQEAIRRSEEIFRSTFENAAVGISQVGLDGCFIQINQKLCEITGYSREELVQKTFHEITYAEDLDADLALIERLERGEIDNYTLEKRYVRKDGSLVWINLTKSVQVDASGNIENYIAIVEDISLRKTMEAAAKESQERFRIALSSVPMFVFTLDSELTYTWAYNPPMGLKPEQVLGKRDEDLFPYEAAAQYNQLKSLVMEQRRGIQQEIQTELEDRRVYQYVTYEPLLDQRGRAVGLTGAILDITQQRKLEAVQAEYRMQMEVQRQLMEQREMERIDIARDLHDGPLQELAAVRITIQDAMATDEKDARIRKLNQVSNMLKKQAHEIRIFCNELRPPALAPYGLEKAILSHIEDFRERHPHIRIHLDLDPDRQTLPENTRMAFFRIYQEALNNIAKHSKADEIWVRLQVDQEEVVMEVEDNGEGFAVPTNWMNQTHNGHLGLIGMRERALSVNADLEIESAPGRGTIVRMGVKRGESLAK
jgi:PAS domain S-box-containing protein